MKPFTILFLLIPVLGFGQTFNIGERTLNYKDDSRNRLVKTEIWYPTFEKDSLKERNTELPFILTPTIRDAKFVNQSFPLILLSHGTGGNRFGLAWLAIELVKNGYIVAAPDHWGNTFDNKIPEYFVRYWERPLDMSFLLTSILNDELFHPYIDEEKIGLVGFSFGGYTALAIGGVNIDCEVLKQNATTKQGKEEFVIPEMGDLTKLISNLSCNEIPKTFKDDRFKTLIALAPALGLGLPDENQNINVPILIIGTENDHIAPIETNALKYNRLIPTSRFTKIEGKAGHYVFLNEGNKELQNEAKQYYQDHKTVQRASIHEQATTEIVEFLKQNLK